MKEDIAREYISAFSKKKILVIGDAMVDIYIEGASDRISPEAPVAVVLQSSTHAALGGAGNVAANVAALGGSATLVSIIGKDASGRTMKDLCRASGIRTHLFVDAGRPTTTKLRIVSRRHQLARVDTESEAPLSGAAEQEFIKIVRALPTQDMVIISDYAKGCITKGVIAALRARFGPAMILADMKPVNVSWYKGIRVITPNLKEAADITGIVAKDDALAQRAAAAMENMLKTSVVLTRGERGVTLKERGSKATRHFSSDILTVKDVTGAGDTLIATLALMIAAGAPFTEAVALANRAAGVVVGMGGTVALSRDELEKSFRA